MLTGQIDKIGEDLYVRYSSTFSNEPTRQTLWWKIDSVSRCPFQVGWPAVGDEVRSSAGAHGWSGAGYTVHFSGSKEAEKVVREPVACPATRGKPARWRDGRWEKLMARGWVPA